MTKISSIKYHVVIDRYMNMVRTGKVLASKEVHQLMDFLDDRLSDPDVVIKTEIIDDALANIDKHFPFKLMEWEEFIMAFICGVFYKDDTLVFNEFLVMMGRGGGKTGFMSVIEWWMISKQGIKQYHVDVVATSEDQAKESVMEVHSILEDNKPKYIKFFKWTLEKIVFRKTKSVLRYRTNNAKTKDGGRQGAVLFDEDHAYEDDKSVKVFTSGLGKKKHPRRLHFTTDGNIRGGFLDGFKEEAKLVLSGERPKRRLFPYICKLDDAEELHDPRNWEKANPSINYFPTLKQEMLDEYEKLEDRPSARIEFMTKRMNLPTTDSWNEVTSWENILATKQSSPNLQGLPAIGGIDYAETTDFVSVGLLIKVGDKYYLKQHTFINKKALVGRSYKVPIDVGVERGLITIINDETIQPRTIANWFIEMGRYYQIKVIAADDFRLKYLQTAFTEAGIGDKLKKARKGIKTHTELEPIVDDLFSYKNIVFCDDDFMMRWYTNNTYKDRDDRLNIEYKKIEPKLRKTDGFFMLLHALQHKDVLDVPVATYSSGLKTYTY